MCNQRHMARRAVGRDDSLLRRPCEFVMLVELVACRVAATAADRECQRALPRGIFILLRTGRGTGAQSRRQSVRTPRPRRLQDRSVLRHGLMEFGDVAMMRRMQLGIKECAERMSAGQ
jgi:hypothetical protein